MALALVALAVPAPAQDSQDAQDSRPAAEAKKSQDARPTRVLETAGLVVKTIHRQVAMAMLDKLGSQDLLPELEEGKHYFLKLFGPGKLKVTTGAGDSLFLEAMATPGPLSSVFEDELAEQLRAIETNVTLTLGQFGIPAKEIAGMIRAMASFPDQIARLDLRVEGNPLKAAKGVKVDLCVVPAKDTWFAKVVAGLAPNDQGAPLLAGVGAPMRLAVAVKPAGLAALVEPMLGLLACLGTRNRHEREASKAMLSKLLDGYDGSMAAAGDPFQSRVRTIAGLRSAAEVKEVMASEAFGKLTEHRASILPAVDAEFQQRAFTHRDVTVSRLTVDMSASGLQQVTAQYSAVAGSYLLSTSGEGEGAAKAMIDAALDQKVKRAPLAKDALLTLTLDLEKMLDHLAGFGIPAPVEDGGPKRAELRMFCGEGSLRLRVSID